jgi:hypothetical protein
MCTSAVRVSACTFTAGTLHFVPTYTLRREVQPYGTHNQPFLVGGMLLCPCASGLTSSPLVHGDSPVIETDRRGRHGEVPDACGLNTDLAVAASRLHRRSSSTPATSRCSQASQWGDDPCRVIATVR